MWDCQQISQHILTDPEESSYVEEMRQRHLEEIRQRRRRLEEMRQQHLEFLEVEGTVAYLFKNDNFSALGGFGSVSEHRTFEGYGGLKSSYGEKEAVAVKAILSDLKQSRHEEEKEEKAAAASRRGGRIWGCICGSRGNGD